MLFWKTYKATARHVDKNLYSYCYFRGTTWEVVGLAQDWASNKEEKGKWALVDLERVK